MKGHEEYYHYLVNQIRSLNEAEKRTFGELCEYKGQPPTYRLGHLVRKDIADNAEVIKRGRREKELRESLMRND